MPTYEYECLICGSRFEQFQSIKDQPLQKCPQCCGKVETADGKRGRNPFFKGSGFYTTDYRSSEYQQKAKAETGSTTVKTENKNNHQRWR